MRIIITISGHNIPTSVPTAPSGPAPACVWNPSTNQYDCPSTTIKEKIPINQGTALSQLLSNLIAAAATNCSDACKGGWGPKCNACLTKIIKAGM